MHLHLTRKGQGRPLVLLHAYPLSGEMWERLPVVPGWERIAPDFPGFGLSAKGEKWVTLQQVAQATVLELEKQGITGPFVLGGISMGGYLAFEILRLVPQRVQALLLVSTRAGKDSPEGRQKRLETAERAEKEGLDWLAGTMGPGLLGVTTKANDQELVERVRSWIQKASPLGVAMAQRAMANRRDHTAFCSNILQKTLIIAGREDGLIPHQESEDMGRRIPESKTILMERVGHLPPVEDPEGFCGLMQRFLDGI